MRGGTYRYNNTGSSLTGKSGTSGNLISILAQPVNNNCINVAPTAVITSPVINRSFTSPANISITANAIDNDGNSEVVKLFPNPNDGHFSIEFINPLQSEKSLNPYLC
jgi:hypothetical protein